MSEEYDPSASGSASGPDHEMLHDIIRVTLKVFYILASIVYYYALAIPIVAIVSTRQEYKIWKTTPTPLTLLGITKVYLYNVIWMGLCLIASLALLPMWIQRGCGNSVSLEANAVMEKIIAQIVQTMIVGPVEIVNPHNIPAVHLYPSVSASASASASNDTDGTHGPAPVFIANHCSQIDCGCVYYVVRRFKWIAKKSVKIIPGAGNIMMLGAHIFIQRTGKNRGSVSNLYEQSNEAIQSGIPMLLFPQGTRRMSTKLPFKDGAFKIAIENEALICPITINVPPGAWNTLYPLNILWGGHTGSGENSNKIIMTIHAPIVVTKDMEIQALREKCQEIIYSALPPLYHGHKDGDDGKRKDGNGDTATGMDKKTK